VKIFRILVPIAMGLAVLVAAGFWTLTTLLPRARPTTPLATAAAEESTDRLLQELRRLGDPNVKDPQGFTPLDWAARNGRADAIAGLVRAGADPDLRDSGPNGWTPLLHAVHKNQPGAVRALLAAGASADGRGENGVTPLMLAAAQGEPEIVAELLAAGADPRLQGPRGWTALERGAANGHSEVIDALLRNDPRLHLGPGPRVWMIRALALVRGRSELLDRIDRGWETAR
jgi:uncharacterized protein